jgi:hypothetical protein
VTAAPHSRSVLLPIATGAIVCLTVAMTLVVIAAAAVALTRLGDDARRMLGFDFRGVEPSPSEAARIALHNARIAGGTLLCAALVPLLSARARQAVDGVLATLLAISAIAAGITVGGYGARAVAALIAHVPLEFAALSLNGGAYLQACQRPLRARELAATAAASWALLIVAAALETYLPIGAAR